MFINLTFDLVISLFISFFCVHNRQELWLREWRTAEEDTKCQIIYKIVTKNCNSGENQVRHESDFSARSLTDSFFVVLYSQFQAICCQ